MQIAQTVTAVATKVNPLAARIMDRRVPITNDLIDQVMSLGQFTWHGRNPKSGRAPDGSPRATNLDLLSLMIDLYRRKARISLRGYKNRLPWQMISEEQHVGGTERFGQIVGLISHRDHLSFSVRIMDESVCNVAAGAPDVGALRTYMIVDHVGQWYEHWKGFDWEKSADELAYLDRRDLMIDGQISFEDYVHLNRRQSVFGAPYLLMKLLLTRINDELTFRRAEHKRLTESFNFSPIKTNAQNSVLAKGPSASVPATTFRMDLSGVSFSNEYSSIQDSYAGYRSNAESIEFLISELRPMVQFVVRADEVAFYRFGIDSDYVAPWIKGSLWNAGSKTGSASIMLGEDLKLSYQTGQKELRVAA